ncbi:MAG: PEP-CTERM sorting domain-containing protein [Planctomycetota bacterium]|jgi:hypothetical protein
MKNLLISAAASAMLLGSATADQTVVDFEKGAAGWTGSQGGGGSTVVETTGGNPGANMHTVFNNFGIEFRNNTNPDFVMDYTQHDSVTLSIDLEVIDISFFGTPAGRPWLVEIRDYQNVPAGYPYVSVWYLFEWVGAGPWTTWSVTIEDTSVAELPAGWGGYGAEDPDTFEPILPANRTFTDVLAGADELAFHTLQPGYFFGFTDFDLRIDNITISTADSVLPGDANGDGVVDVADLTEVILAWGPCAGACPADFDGDGLVDVVDLVTVISNWS